jgi:hypothetical protein
MRDKRMPWVFTRRVQAVAKRYADYCLSPNALCQASGALVLQFFGMSVTLGHLSVASSAALV